MKKLILPVIALTFTVGVLYFFYQRVQEPAIPVVSSPAIREASKVLSMNPYLGAFHDEAELVIPSFEENPDIFDASKDVGLDLRSHVGKIARHLRFRSNIQPPHHCDWDKWLFSAVLVEDKIVGAWLNVLPGSHPMEGHIYSVDPGIGCA